LFCFKGKISIEVSATIILSHAFFLFYHAISSLVQTEGKRKMEFKALANGYALLASEGSIRRVVKEAVTPPAAVRAVAVKEYSC
jgi:hypothetical protein